MTENLREYPAELRALAARVAEWAALPASYVEKDFWVTEVLRVASKPRPIALPDGEGEVTFIFKGGTSLSRVYGIIHRFSEDVDLLAVMPVGATVKARHAVLKAVDQDVANHLRFRKGFS